MAKPTMMIRKLCLLALLPGYALATEPVPARPADATPMTRVEAEALVERAEALRKEAKSSQGEAEARRLRDYNACLDKFLVNACRDDVRQQFIDTMNVIRKQEIEANQLSRVAKARLNELNDAERQAPKPAGKPSSGPAQSKSKPLPKPYGKPSQGQPSKPAAPTQTVSPEAQARSDAEKAAKVREAAKQQTANEEAARKRAEQAANDKARYERRQQEHAEKAAKRASSSSKKASLQ